MAKPSLHQIPSDPHSRSRWVYARVRDAGHTWRSLAAEFGVTPQALQQTASGRPSRRLEQHISDFLQIPAQELFPEHYAKNGNRIPIERAPAKHGQRIGHLAQININSPEAA